MLNFVSFLYTCSFVDRDVMNDILSNAPDQMIKFKVYKRNLISSGSNIDRRLNLVANRKKLPYGVWANLVVESIQMCTSSDLWSPYCFNPLSILG